MDNVGFQNRVVVPKLCGKMKSRDPQMTSQISSRKTHDLSIMKVLKDKVFRKGGVKNFNKFDKTAMGRLVNEGFVDTKNLALTMGIHVNTVRKYARFHREGYRLQEGVGRPRILTSKNVAEIDRIVRRDHK